MTIFQTLTNQVSINDVVKEMEKRYLNSYLVIDDVFITYKGFNPNTNDFIFSDITNKTLMYHYDSDVDIKIPKIVKGFYDSPDGVLFVCSNPYRQWRRGISSGTVYMTPLLNLWQAAKSPNVFRYQYLQCLVNIPDKKLKDVINICEKKGSVTLTRDFAISLHITKKSEYMLWYNSFVIGEIQGNKLSIQHPYFIQEVKDSYHLWNNFEVCYDTIK